MHRLNEICVGARERPQLPWPRVKAILCDTQVKLIKNIGKTLDQWTLFVIRGAAQLFKFVKSQDLEFSVFAFYSP